MRFFALLFLIDLIITVFLIYKLVAYIKVRNQAKTLWDWYKSTLLTLICLCIAVFLTVPKAIDMTTYFDSEIPVAQIEVEPFLPLGYMLKTSEGYFFYSPFSYSPKNNERYQISYMPSSHYITSFRNIETDESQSNNQDKGNH